MSEMDWKDPGGIACRTDRAFRMAHFALVRTRARLCMTETSVLSSQPLALKIAWYNLIAKWMFTPCFGYSWLTCMSLISTVYHSLLASARSRVMLLFLLNWTCLALDWFDIPCWTRCRSYLWKHTCLWLVVAHILVSLNAFTYTSCIAFIA